MLIRRTGEIGAFTASDGTRIRELLHPERHGVEMGSSVAHATLPPGARSRSHRLKNTEIYYILEGTGTMHVGDESSDVGPGDAIYIPPMSVQYIENKGDGDLTFLCIVDPAWRAEDDEPL